MYSFPQTCLEKKSLSDCAKQSFKGMTADCVQDQICSLYTVCVSAAPGRKGEGFKAVGCPLSRDHPVAGGLVAQCEGSGFFVPGCKHMK